jgi:large subunit ribosomal protein L24
MHVKKGDNIIVLAGKDKGKTGKVLRALPKENRVLIEGVNIKKVHERSKKGGKGKGGVIEKSFPIHASNVKLSEKKEKVEKAEKKAPKAKAKKEAKKEDK